MGVVSPPPCSSFGPLWEVLKTMCEKLVTVHSDFVKVLGELAREVHEYHHAQKEKSKANVSLCGVV